MTMPNLLTAGFAVAVLAGGLAGPAAAATTQPTTAPRACFWTRDVTNFQPVDDRTVNIRVGVRDVYQLALFSPAPDIDWSSRIGIESRGGSTICSGLDATILVPSELGMQRYPVTSVRKLSPQEVAALPAKARP